MVLSKKQIKKELIRVGGCAFVVCKTLKTGFLTSRSICESHKFTIVTFQCGRNTHLRKSMLLNSIFYVFHIDFWR